MDISCGSGRYCGHLELFVDIGLVHKRVQDIEHRVDIPNLKGSSFGVPIFPCSFSTYLRVPFQSLNFVFRLLGKLAAELTERLR